MAVALSKVLHQGPVLKSLVGAAIAAQRSKGSKGTATAPGPELTETVPARSPDLVAAYLQHLGVPAGRYEGEVPPHLFPQWTFPLLSKVLQATPYDLTRMLNAGCSMQVNAPIPMGEPLTIRAQLVQVDDTESRAILSTTLITSTPSAPDALVASINTFVPKPRPKDAPKGPKKKKEPELVPHGAIERVRWQLDARAGLDFALLTGDFNPIHWIPAAGRAAGFGGCILHGFGTFARSVEGLIDTVCEGDATRLERTEVKFTAPVKLPGEAALFTSGDHAFFTGIVAGAPASMVGTYTLSETSP